MLKASQMHIYVLVFISQPKPLPTKGFFTISKRFEKAILRFDEVMVKIHKKQ